jgi:hypothetical protein
MLLEEILPHVNKLVSLYMTKNRRRVGWLITDSSGEEGEIYFLTAVGGTKVFDGNDIKDLERLKKRGERIAIDEIVKIRSIE